MINLRQYKRIANIVAVLGLLAVGRSLSAQAPGSRSDANQIIGLMAGLSDHSKAPADVLDPNLNPSDRDKNLHRFNVLNYDLSLVPTEGIPPITGDTISIPVRVHFNGKDGNTLDATATAQFVKRHGTWYFSNFNFMGWPGFLIAVLVACILVGIGYAATVLALWNKLSRRGQLGANGVKMFLPIFWPSLFRQIRRTSGFTR